LAFKNYNLPYVYRVFWSCDQRDPISLSSWYLGHSAVKFLSIFHGCASSWRHYFRFSDYRSKNLPFKYEQLVLFPFGHHPRLTAVEQNWRIKVLWMVNFVWRERWLNCRCLRSPKKHLFAVWILCYISRFTSFVGVIRDPRYTNSLMTS
jgi:hypothetical protein